MLGGEQVLLGLGESFVTDLPAPMPLIERLNIGWRPGACPRLCPRLSSRAGSCPFVRVAVARAVLGGEPSEKGRASSCIASSDTFIEKFLPYAPGERIDAEQPAMKLRPVVDLQIVRDSGCDLGVQPLAPLIGQLVI
jgi:hypothetical protein